MTFLPDTNAFSRGFRGDDARLKARFVAHWAEIRLSVIVLGELEFGACKSGVPRHRLHVDGLLATVAAVEPWTAADAALYGRLRADLEKRGIIVGAFDLQIAAQALRLGAVCVTHNQREFSRVPGLRLADWQTIA